MRSLRANEHVNLIFRALSDPIRLRVVRLLLEGELCVCDLVKVLRVPQPTASRHLAYLRKAGLVLAREEWRWSHYSLAPAKGPFQEKALDCIRCCLAEVPAIEADARRLAKLRGKGGCSTAHRRGGDHDRFMAPSKPRLGSADAAPAVERASARSKRRAAKEPPRPG